MLKSFTLVYLLSFIGVSFAAQKLESVVPYRLDEVNFSNGRITITKTKEVLRGEGLYQVLTALNIDNALALELINTLRDEVEFSKLKVGDELTATYNQFSQLIGFSLSMNPVETHTVSLDETNQWRYTFKERPTVWLSRVVEGVIESGSTLQGALLQQGFSQRASNDIVSALMCKVNFRMHARVGDEFKALIRERKFQDQVIETKVLYTYYKGQRAGEHETFLYEDEEKGSTFTAHYTEDGQALIRSGLRYPLSRMHVRSNYGMRRHPVTGRRTMHRGVDLRGRRGQAVRAVAAGKVIQSTYNKYAGNKIAIRHSDGSVSYYLHLNKRNVRRGSYVRSYQVIGTVGATGRVTGPHLHFGFKRSNGRWMNPLSKRMIATPRLSGVKFERLQEQVYATKQLLLDLQLSKESDYLLAQLPNRLPANDDLKIDELFSFRPYQL